MLSFALRLYAVPAYPNPIKIKQPDGTTLTITLKGDEWKKWASTPDGYTLLKNKDRIYEYAIINKDGNLIPSGVRASEINLRNLQEKSLLSKTQKNLFFSQSQSIAIQQITKIKLQESSQPEKAFPTSGSRKLVCILIGFTDLQFTLTQNDYDILFNQVGYNYDGAIGSVRDFYLTNSYNLLDITTTVVGPYTAANNMAYYGANDANDNNNDIRPRELITEAVHLANPNVNYANYDNNNDGNVDGVYVIYAGYGEEAGASDDAIWAHKWGITPIQLDGKWVSTYSCSAEYRGNSGMGISRIGVICHEFGHVLGAPDFYDTNYSNGGSYTGTGSWDMMAGGSWGGGDGRSPAHHNGYTKWAYYNWITPQEITQSGYYSLRNAAQYKDCFIFTSATSNEFWFLENRQQIGFDASIPGHGLIIYHVDENGIATAGNQINATHPQYMYPVAANATDNPPNYGTINSASCPFPGTANKTSFTDYTTPRAYSWGEQPSNKPINDIREESETVYFTFMGGNAPLFFTAISYNTNSITLTWNKNVSLDPVLIAYSIDGVFGDPVDGNNYFQGNTISGGGTVIYNGSDESFIHNSLPADTRYYYRAWSVLSGNNYSTGVSSNTKTICFVISTFPYNEDFSLGSLPNCWDIVDIANNGNVWTFSNPRNREILTATASNGFAIIDSDAYGINESQNSELLSPVFNFSNFTDITLQFEHFFNQFQNSTATLFYTINNGASWNPIHSWETNTQNPEIFNLDLSSQLENQNLVRFKWLYTGSNDWYWAIDDVLISANSISTVPENNTVSNQTISDGNSECFNATNQLTVAGDGYPIIVEDGASVNFIAGESIRFLPGFYAHAGSSVNAYITTNETYCNNFEQAVASASEIIADNNDFKSANTYTSTSKETIDKQQNIIIYPNPNNGKFTIDLHELNGLVTVNIYNTIGSKISNLNTIAPNVIDFELSSAPKGLYYVLINNSGKTYSKKILISNY